MTTLIKLNRARFNSSMNHEWTTESNMLVVGWVVNTVGPIRLWFTTLQFPGWGKTKIKPFTQPYK